MCLMLHRMARVYGVLPSVILKLPADELAICLACLQQADATLAQGISAAKSPPIPVYVVEI